MSFSYCFSLSEYHDSKLNKNVESGTLKLVDERKALQEISSLRRVRKTVEAFQTEEDDIKADRAKVDELRKQLDDPEVKANSERYDQIKAELDEMKKDSDEVYKNRSKLFDERTALSGELDALWKKKKAGSQEYREAQDVYWKKVQEDRAKRAEKYKSQAAADEASKKRAIAEELLENARHPAFAAEVVDCQTLIDYFAGKSGSSEATSSSAFERAEVAGAPKLEIRKVESDVQGLVARKKKGEDEENYFVAKKTKKPATTKKSAPAPPPAQTSKEPSAASTQLQIPFGTLSGLLALSIPPPASSTDIPRVIEDLKTKKAWFQANRTCNSCAKLFIQC